MQKKFQEKNPYPFKLDIRVNLEPAALVSKVQVHDKLETTSPV
jgi:hypothetical protein